MSDKKIYQYSYWHREPRFGAMTLQIVKVQLTEKELFLEQLKHPDRYYVQKNS